MLLQNGIYIFIYYIGRPFFFKVFLNDFLKLFSKRLLSNIEIIDNKFLVEQYEHFLFFKKSSKIVFKNKLKI